MVISYPRIFWTSLQNTLIPAFNLVKKYYGGQELAVDRVKRWPPLIQCGVRKCLPQNVETLRDLGVPEIRVTKLITGLSCYSIFAKTKPQYLKKVVSTVKNMGFDPCSSSFEHAIQAMAGQTESGWVKKVKVYKSLGLSENEINEMFKKQPISLWMSEKKILAATKFYFEKFNWKPSHLLKNPNALMYSLEKRVVPRCSVLQVLAVRNKVKNVNIITLLVKTENEFLERYVNNYKDEIPEVLEAYQGPSYMQFVYNATELPSEETYDYIIIGGGTAGCPLAATLSSFFRVLVIERGGIPYGNPNLMTQEGFLTALTDVDTYTSPAQAFTSDDGVPNARGRVLGGSSAINAGFYSRADSEFYRNSGVKWEMRVVNQSYEWVERAIVFRPELRDWQSAIRDGMLEAGISPFNGFTFDHKLGTKIGGSTFDSSGRRHSAADLLSYSRSSNVKVAIHASVQRVLLDSSTGSKPAAVGVVYRDELGQYHRAMIREKGEVLISAGAIGSPQLLLLSGIGPRPYLSSWGIPVAHHLPYVGQFLYDNPRNGISIVPPTPLEHSLIQVVGITDSGAYLEAASNIIPFSSPARSVFIRNPSSPLYLTVATVMEKITGPLSVGSLRLASTDVRVNPLVRFNYFSNPVDLEKCVNGTRRIGAVLRSRSMEIFRYQQWLGREEFRYVGPALPVDQSDHVLMREFCRRTVSTIWHYHGGCLVGRVVDRNFRVIGVDNLRVVDGSTFTVSPGTNPQATVLMMGRYVGMKILRERMKRRQ